MFERFTDRARRVVVLAQDEARMLNHSYIGTEHILLGLLREQEGAAARVLLQFTETEPVRSKVEQIIGQGRDAPGGHIPFTPRAKKVLELSLREAMQLGHNYIGTEHILLGLIREGEGVAAKALVKLGVDLNKVRQAVLKELESGQDVPQSDPATSTPVSIETVAVDFSDGTVQEFPNVVETTVTANSHLILKFANGGTVRLQSQAWNGYSTTPGGTDVGNADSAT